ncbi:MAG TPA: hypothetical protein VKY81_01160 [Natronosporangium sp.]|nr:hypothetical protein [Natronosporangium sp.]
MSNRRRTATARSYTARLEGRSAPKVPRRRRPLPARPAAPPVVAAALAVAVELGHLAAALVEWPQSTTRGIYHVLAGAAFGLLAVAVHTGAGRLVRGSGAAVAGLGPVVWAVGAVVGAPPYAHLPLPGAAALTAAEVALAALLLAPVRETGRAPSRAAGTRPTRAGAAAGRR